MKVGRMFVNDHRSSCLSMSHMCLVVSLHIVLVCVVFMAIFLWFGKGLLSLMCCELSSALGPILLALFLCTLKC